MLRGRRNQKTAPTEQVLSTDEVIANARMNKRSSGKHLDHIQRLIQAATEYHEEHTAQQFLTATWEYFLESFPDRNNVDTFVDGRDLILLPKPPLISVTTVNYVDVDGVTQTLAATEYDVDINAKPGFISQAYNKSWPSIRTQRSAITIEFQAGYGLATAVPETIKHALRMLVGHWYNNPEAVVVEEGRLTVVEVPMAYNMLLMSESFIEVGGA